MKLLSAAIQCANSQTVRLIKILGLFFPDFVQGMLFSVSFFVKYFIMEPELSVCSTGFCILLFWHQSFDINLNEWASASGRNPFKKSSAI